MLNSSPFTINTLVQDVIFCPDLGDAVSQKWYQEIDHWSFKNHDRKDTSPPKAHIGYFTAMLWKETRKFGIGFGEENGKLFIVARYFPHPNAKGQFKENVQPLIEYDSSVNEEMKMKLRCLEQKNTQIK